MAEKWVLLCRRTNDPKLSYIESVLAHEGIKSRRNGESWHAPILEVQAEDKDRAWEILGSPARLYGVKARHGVSLDDVPDDHRSFVSWVQP